MILAAETTIGQKVAATRRHNKAAQKAKEQRRKQTITALEDILHDSKSSRSAKEHTLFLLANVYRRYLH